MEITSRVGEHLRRLAGEIGPRPIGSPGNREAAAYIGRAFRTAGLGVREQEFACPEWTEERALLQVGGAELAANANPFSPPCAVTAPSVAAGTLPELEAAELSGKVVLLYGDLTKSQLGAKGAIWRSERDRRVVEVLEAARPAALVTVAPTAHFADGRTEDWRLAIPSLTVSGRVGLWLLDRAGEPVRVEIESRTIDGSSANIVGYRAGRGAGRIVLCAHYDTKFRTPGAYDNAGGVAALLALAELLGGEDLPLGLELVAFSGEEYGGLGDMEYLRRERDAMTDIIACINIDGAGQKLGTNSYTTLAGAPAFDGHVARVAAPYLGVVSVEPWSASDHYTFYSRGVPSVAITSIGVTDLIHTPQDTPEWVSPEKLAEVVLLVADFVRSVQDKAVGWGRPEAR